MTFKNCLWALCFFVLAVLCTHARSVAANNESCTVSAASIAFGSFNVYIAPLVVTGTLSGTCLKGNGQAAANISVTLDNGLSLQGNGNRAMTCSTCTGAFASDLLQYQIYTTAATTTAWIGATAITTANPCPCGNTSTAWGPVTMYGLIATPVAGGVNDSSVGTYGDTVTVTLNF